MSLIDQFERDTKNFLETHPIHVHEECDQQLQKGVRKFTLREHRIAPMVELCPLAKGRAIKAHWLPWQTHGTASMELTTDETHIFFTSELSGCRITIELQDTRVLLAHFAGNIDKGGVGRNRAEKELFQGRPRRRLTQCEHYPDKWAFVVGNYTEKRGWRFAAQINSSTYGQDGGLRSVRFIQLLNMDHWKLVNV
jgi:hypothetical protein